MSMLLRTVFGRRVRDLDERPRFNRGGHGGSGRRRL